MQFALRRAATGMVRAGAVATLFTTTAFARPSPPPIFDLEFNPDFPPTQMAHPNYIRYPPQDPSLPKREPALRKYNIKDRIAEAQLDNAIKQWVDAEIATMPKTPEELEAYENDGITQDPEFWKNPTSAQFMKLYHQKDTYLEENDALAFVFAHSDVFQRNWKEIMKYEQKFIDDGSCTIGPRPHEIHPYFDLDDFTYKARLANIFTSRTPVSRHDFTINRCETPVKYIIETYTDKSGKETIDCRPAMIQSSEFKEPY